MGVQGVIVLIDNYDSFTYILADLLKSRLIERGLAPDLLKVFRNDEITLSALWALGPLGVVLSPGPGLPRGAGICMDLVHEAPRGLPIFGVCLGMQIIAEAFGGRLIRAPRPMHGRTSVIRHDGRGCFQGLPERFRVMRYHSWAVDPASLPPVIVPSAWADDGVLMGLRHKEAPIEALQFHPESFLTEWGAQMVDRFIDTLEELPCGFGRAR
ncbi:MAG: aminodeoxychorismate/anthranilate synthase component II [Sandaracinaceae bacterium]|nr:aminodeoxychorismate/anthranilate synthase component II [Sandaracinaceae bacterium]